MYADLYERRKNAFDNIDRNLKTIINLIKSVDKDSEVYLFGSVLKGNYNYASDIDILIITKNKDVVYDVLWNNNYSDPYEFHVKSKEESKYYFKHIKDIKKIS